MGRLKNSFLLGAYSIFKPGLFIFDAELMHKTFIGIGKILGSNIFGRVLVGGLFNYQNKKLEQKILGMSETRKRFSSRLP
jgi:hypothetical protein